MNNSSIRNFALAGVAAVSAVGILGATLAQAADPSPSATPAAATQQATPTSPQPQGNTDYITSLAGNLGIDAATLEAAITKTNLDAINAQEAAGTITADQAAQMRQHVQDDAAAGRYMLGTGGRPGGKDGHGGPGFRGEDASALASFLGMTTDELRTAQETSSLATIAAAHGKSRDELKAFLTDAAKTQLAQAVTDGKLTQAEADAKLSELTTNFDARIDAVGHGPAGRPGRGSGGTPAAPGSSTTPTTTN
jgi:hypothetical protein